VSGTEFDARERRNWSGLADSYGQTYARVCAGAVHCLTKSAPIEPGVRVLDVGTGTGTVAAAATSLGARVTAVDADPAMVEMAAGLVPGAKFRLAALPALPFDDAQFDVVLANFVINHVSRPLAALAELRRVATAGGHVDITTWPQPPSPGAALLTRAIRDCGAERRVSKLASQEGFPRTEAGLRGLAEAAALRNVTCRAIDWTLVVRPADWWNIASGVSWMREFIADPPPQLLGSVRRRFEQLSREFRTPHGKLALPFIALLAGGHA
jgi:SAM-dependent methyltransferase